MKTKVFFVLIVPNYSCHLGVYGQGRGAPSFQKREGRAFTSLKSLTRVERRAGRSPSRFPPAQQVTDEKTCMQFSIRRPKLPSSETHPEESVHRRLDVSAWLGHLNELGQVEEEYKLRKVRPGALGDRSQGQVGATPWGCRSPCARNCVSTADRAITAAASGLGVPRSLYRRARSGTRHFPNRGLGRDVRTTRPSERHPGGVLTLK